MDNVIYRREIVGAETRACGVVVTEEVNGYAVWELTPHPDGAERNFLEFITTPLHAREVALETAVTLWTEVQMYGELVRRNGEVVSLQAR